jgi:uncharacterized protein YoxC
MTANKGKRFYQDGPEHDCQQTEKFMEIAKFTGQIDESVKNIKSDINVLFDQNRKIIARLDALTIDVVKVKMKFGLIGAAIGGVSSVVGNFIMMYMRNKGG